MTAAEREKYDQIEEKRHKKKMAKMFKVVK